MEYKKRLKFIYKLFYRPGDSFYDIVFCVIHGDKRASHRL